MSFSLKERDRRWARVRELMGEQAIDVLVAFPEWVAGDALYLADRPGAVVFPLEGAPTVVAGRADPNPPPNSWIQDVRGATATGSTRAPYGGGVATRLRELDFGKAPRIGIAGLTGGVYVHVRQPEGVAPYSSVMRVREARPDAEIVDASSIMGEARYVKGEEEIEAIRQAVKLAEASADAMVEHARPGVKEAEVFAHMVFEQIRRGSEDYHIGWKGSVWGEPSPRYLGAPAGTIQPGWFIENEIIATVHHYASQICQPVSVGPAPAAARELFEMGKAAFVRASELMRPGATWGEVERGVRAVARGTKYDIHLLVHGRGLFQYTSYATGGDGPLLIPSDTHEHVKDDPIRAGTTFVLKPYAYLADRASGDANLRVTWGDSVVVRDEGAKRLGTRPHELISV